MPDTAQQRAEAVLQKIGCYWWPYRVNALIEFEQQARREALEEAARVVNIYNCDHDHGKKATKACDDIVELLDRLREGR